MTVEQLKEAQAAGNAANFVSDVETVFRDFPVRTVKPDALRFINNGNTLFPSNFTEEETEDLNDGDTVRIRDPEGQFLALYRFRKEDMEFKAFKMFLSR